MTFADRMIFRMKVLRAMAFVALARFFVRFVPLPRWRNTVGDLVEAGAALTVRSAPLERGVRNAVQSAVNQIDRACLRLPGTSRCLPRAIALGWLLRKRSLPLLTVIAFSKVDRTGEDAYHAWVECNGEMLIGVCERDTYQPIMVLASAPVLKALASQRK